MTTLATDSPRVYQLGELDDVPMIAADIIYEGAAVGVVSASGHARPLVAFDRFVGFATKKVDNSSGAAAALNVNVATKGDIRLAVTGALITDRQAAVYASDDDTFTFNPADGSFVGFVKRFVSAGVVVVEFNVNGLRDPWHGYAVRETLTGVKTFDAEDCGKLFCVTAAADAAALTLPAIAAGVSGLSILYVGAYGGALVKITPNASDMILGPDITGADNKYVGLTKATARRGDFAELIAGDADGYMITRLRGTWAREA